MAPNWENKTHVSKEIGKGEGKSEKESRRYCNLIVEGNTRGMEGN